MSLIIVYLTVGNQERRWEYWSDQTYVSQLHSVQAHILGKGVGCMFLKYQHGVVVSNHVTKIPELGHVHFIAAHCIKGSCLMSALGNTITYMLFHAVDAPQVWVDLWKQEVGQGGWKYFWSCLHHIQPVGRKRQIFHFTGHLAARLCLQYNIIIGKTWHMF